MRFLCVYKHLAYNSKTCLRWPLKKKTKIGFQDRLSLNAGQKYCLEHSAILSTFFKLQFVLKTFVLSNFERPFQTGFTASNIYCNNCRISTDSSTVQLSKTYLSVKLCLLSYSSVKHMFWVLIRTVSSIRRDVSFEPRQQMF